MVALPRRLGGAASSFNSFCMGLMTVSVVASMDGITVQARPMIEDAEIEAYLNRVNKPAVKSFVLEDGDIIDCVDIYKQPAFDHPLLKDHKIIMTPSFFPKKKDKIANATIQPLALEPTLPDGKKCPKGTIPIRRTLKSDLIHAKSLDGYGRRDDKPGYEMVERAGKIAYAGRDSYIAAMGKLNWWAVPEVELNEWSHAVIELADKAEQSFIEGGWLANPSIFWNKNPRLYAYWTADGYHNTGCYNLLCPGFVQTNDTYALGISLRPPSDYDGVQREISITIYKDEDMKVWWLVIQNTNVGYWPMSIFVNGNFPDAGTVKWTGSVLNMRNGGQHTITDMGSGHFADQGRGKAAYIRGMEVMQNRQDGFYEPPPLTYWRFADNFLCYSSVLDEDYNTVYYGGSGLGARHCE